MECYKCNLDAIVFLQALHDLLLEVVCLSAYIVQEREDI